MTNLRSLSELFKAAMKLAAACAFATAIASVAAAQTNTFPENGNAGIGTTSPSYPLTVNQTGNSVNKLVSLANDSSGSSAQSAISFFEGATEKFKFGMNSSGATGYVGGTNAFQLWHFQNAPIVFGTNSSERMRINGDGNIGIGTASPGVYKLYVDGYILSRGTIPALSLYTDATQNSEDGHSIISGTDNVLRVREVTAGVSETRMVIDSSGNFGIGINTPNYKLDVQGGQINSSGGLCIAGDCKTAWSQVGGGVTSVFGRTGAVVAATNDYTWAQINKSTSSLADITTRSASDLSSGTLPDGRFPATLPALSGANLTSLNASNLTSGTVGATRLGSGTPNSTTFLRGDSTWAAITSSQWANGSGNINYTSGNVGIGTTSPTRQLTISGSNQADLALVSVDQGGSVSDGFNLQQSGSNTHLINREAGTMAFWTNGVQQMTILNGGNVGIGTANPGSRLHVSSSGLNAEVRITDTTTGNPYLSFYDGSTAKGYVQYAAGTMDFYAPTGVAARIVTNSTERLRVDVSGNVGIGTASPASGYKLDVNGNTNVTGNLNVTGNINAKYQDLAEWVPSSEQLSAGTVVVLDTTKSNQVVSSTVGYDTRVAGVISAQPGITLGEGGEGKVLVATTGRVRVKVDASRGAIQIGDLLVTSDVSGVAMKSEPVEFAGRKMHMPGTIIGKALEPLSKGKGEILVLLSLQ